MTPRNLNWRPDEIRKLALLYHMGATLKETARTLGKSKLSIDKKITRLDLRPRKTACFKMVPRRFLPPSPCQKNLLNSLATALKEFPVGDNIDIKKYLQEKYPLQKKRKLPGLLPCQRFAQHDLWRTTEQLLRFLKGRKITVTPLKNEHTKRLGYTHVIKGRPATWVDILKEANTMRHKKGQDPFFLIGTTVQ